MNDTPYHIANQIIINAQSMTSDIISNSININETILSGIQAVWSAGASPIGTLTVQVSNNDIDYTDFGSSLAVAGNSGSDAFNLQELGFGFMRVHYTAISGTGTLTVSCNRKSL